MGPGVDTSYYVELPAKDTGGRTAYKKPFFFKFFGIALRDLLIIIRVLGIGRKNDLSGPVGNNDLLVRIAETADKILNPGHVDIYKKHPVNPKFVAGKLDNDIKASGIHTLSVVFGKGVRGLSRKVIMPVVFVGLFVAPLKKFPDIVRIYDLYGGVKALVGKDHVHIVVYKGISVDEISEDLAVSQDFLGLVIIGIVGIVDLVFKEPLNAFLRYRILIVLPEVFKALVNRPCDLRSRVFGLYLGFRTRLLFILVKIVSIKEDHEGNGDREKYKINLIFVF